MKNHVLYILGYLACILCSYPNGVSVSVDGLDYPTKKRKVETASRQTNRQVWRVGNIRLDPQSANDETPDLKTNDSNSGESKLKAIPSDGVGSARMMTGGRNLLQQKIWNRLDAMDKMIVGNTLPLVGLTSIVPIVSSIDLFWVNQLGDALSVSAQSAANTVYQFSFGLFSFLPSVTATLVSKSYASNDMEKTENIIITAFYFGLVAISIMSMSIFTNPSRFLGTVIKNGSPALAISEKYMRIRSLSLIPQMVTYICFSAFRGMLVFNPCIKITLIAAAINVVLTPLLIHTFKFGILGSAISAFVCDSIAAILYMELMASKGFFAGKKLLRLPSWKEMSPILKGTPLQARSFAMQFINLMVARKIQSLDDTGVAPAAFTLAMQTFFTGGVLIWALGMSTQTLYPSSVAKCEEQERRVFVKTLIKRLLTRGFGVGTAISCIQAALIPFILRSTPVVEVREAAFFPILVVVVTQGIQGMVSVGEGIMVGDGKFTLASTVLIVASIGYIGCLQFFPQSWGINGVFVALGVFTLLRLTGFVVFLPSIMNHHTLSKTTPGKKAA